MRDRLDPVGGLRGLRGLPGPHPVDAPRRELSAAEADQLLDGRGGHPGLRRLLDAAAGPAQERELAGEGAARAVFAAAGVLSAIETATVAPPKRRFPQLTGVRTVTSVLALLGTATGGVALAASETAPGTVGTAPTAVPGPVGPPQPVLDAVGGALEAARAPRTTAADIAALCDAGCAAATASPPPARSAHEERAADRERARDTAPSDGLERLATRAAEERTARGGDDSDRRIGRDRAEDRQGARGPANGHGRG